MKIVQCQCGRTIEVRGGIWGLQSRFPQLVYLCPCGTAYIPEGLGCRGFHGIEDMGKPKILSPSEYAEWKEKELKVAEELKDNPYLNLDNPKEAIIEIPAKVVEETKQES